MEELLKKPHPLPEPTPSDLPRWRGFNLLEKFSADRPSEPYREDDFRMISEWGAYKNTPHEVTLRWAEDCLHNWKNVNWGWALWNFRGTFGILDSGREDVPYEDYRGHQLDRKLLDLLQRF